MEQDTLFVLVLLNEIRSFRIGQLTLHFLHLKHPAYRGAGGMLSPMCYVLGCIQHQFWFK